MPKNRIRHIALMAADTKKIAAFYMSAFGMHEIMRRDKPNPAIYLSDGYINLAILPNDSPESNNAPPGLHHFGFEEGYVRDPEGPARRRLCRRLGSLTACSASV